MIATNLHADATTRNRYVYIASAVCALGGLLFGFDTGIISGAVLFITDDLELSPFLEGAVVSGILVGAIIGAGGSGPLADRFGRRKTTIAAGIVFAVGALGSAFATDVWSLIIARIVLGLAVGSSTIFVPLYIAEIAPKKSRGALSTLFQLAITIGVLTAYGVNYALAGAEAWRWMLGLGAVPAIILVVGMLPLKESPRWLAIQGRQDEARSVLRRARNTEQEVDDEMRAIEDAKQHEEAGWGELKRRWVRPLLIVGIGLAIGQQIVGINTIIYYAPTIMQSTGFGAATAIAATVGIGVVNVLFTGVALVVIDRVGRKKLLLMGLVGMAVSLLILGLGFALPTSSGATAAVTFIGLLLYIASFGASFGVVLWVILPEIFPTRIRGVAMSLCTICHWSANLAVSLSFLPLVEAIGQTPVFWGYCAISIGAFVFVAKLVPETKGRSLEQIESDLRSKSHVAMSER